MQRLLVSIVAVCCSLLVVWGCVYVRVDAQGEIDERVQTDVEMVRQAISEVRSFGTVFEVFAIDNNEYPTSDEIDRVLDGLPLYKVEALSQVLKNYGPSLPKSDPWDSPYLFWSNGQSYAVICLGGDSEISKPDKFVEMLRIVMKGDDLERVRSQCLEDEIVFANGVFVWSLRDSVRWCEE